MINPPQYWKPPSKTQANFTQVHVFPFKNYEKKKMKKNFKKDEKKLPR
jgi:hypothetical protein